MKPVPFAKKRDFLVIGALLLAACLPFAISRALWLSQAAYAQIVISGSVAMEVRLDRDQTIELAERPAVRLSVKDGAIAFVQSDCRDQICVHSGYLKRPGDFAACLPNKVLLFIRGEGEPDAIAK